MRQCVVCERTMRTRKCPHDGWPTLRLVRTGVKIAAGVLLCGRYLVEAEIGRGGFARVYAGIDTRTDQRIAIKVLSRLDPKEVGTAARRFVREAAVTAGLTHGNVIRVFDYGQTDQRQLFLVMEQLDGEPLSDRIQRLRGAGQTMTAAEVVMVGSGALQGLAAAHDAGLVHRDIKPENIFMHRLSTGGEIVKLIDFGIVRLKSSEMTQAGQPIGTPTHMSPEQAQGQELDARSDLYSLGVVLYECASGRLPFAESPSNLVTMLLHVSEPLPPLDEAFDPAVAAVIHKALEKRASDRWQTAREMREALRAAMGSRPRSGKHRRASLSTRSTSESDGRSWKDTHAMLARRRASRMALARDPRRPSRQTPAAAPPPPDPPAPRDVGALAAHSAPTQLLPPVDPGEAAGRGER